MIESATSGTYKQLWDSDTFSGPRGQQSDQGQVFCQQGLGQKESTGISPRNDWVISLAFTLPNCWVRQGLAV